MRILYCFWFLFTFLTYVAYGTDLCQKDLEDKWEFLREPEKIIGQNVSFLNGHINVMVSRDNSSGGIIIKAKSNAKNSANYFDGEDFYNETFIRNKFEVWLDNRTKFLEHFYEGLEREKFFKKWLEWYYSAVYIVENVEYFRGEKDTILLDEILSLPSVVWICTIECGLPDYDEPDRLRHGDRYKSWTVDAKLERLFVQAKLHFFERFTKERDIDRDAGIEFVPPRVKNKENSDISTIDEWIEKKGKIRSYAERQELREAFYRENRINDSLNDFDNFSSRQMSIIVPRNSSM